MIRKRLLWKLWPSYLLIVMLAVFAVALYAGRIMRQHYYELTQQQLLSIARLLSSELAPYPSEISDAAVDEISSRYAQYSNLRVTIVLPSGTVVADTEKNPAIMDNHGDRPEILDAWRKPFGIAIRRSDTLKRDLMYVAVPIFGAQNKRVASARVSLAMASIEEDLHAMYGRLAVAGLLFALVGGLLSILTARRLSVPLQRIRQWAVDFAEGRDGGRLPSSDITEIDVLSSTINSMADQLNVRISQIKEQLDEQAALFFCMGEGVLAVNNQRELIKLNQAASKLFALERDRVIGQSVIGAIRNADLQEIIDQALGADTPVEGVMHILEQDKYLQVSGAPLHGQDGKRVGAILVLNDVTQLRKLETMRRDFVANVSHELKTPITSIKGFAETLLEQKDASREDLDRFLGIIRRQANRLQAIVEDLLSLSSIEYSTDATTPELTACKLKPVLESAVRSCAIMADAKEQTITVDCPEHVVAHLNIPAMEQAVINLVENAIKYGKTAGALRVCGKGDAEGITISVSDDGPGIAEKHIERIFERFYRIDKSRSRKQGGTGLGLAIVKRIAIMHGGTVCATSELGVGSTFTISLPNEL